jgi:hypothetical protein
MRPLIRDSFLDAPAIKAELQRFKVMEKEVTKKADTKMRGSFIGEPAPRYLS